ncbi:uncharacterized protein VTP21DRAFT_2886 [Calcarisporiella thermophila]|uniref:uncharacterized protein n=1 Tax=Calcarisporiella thermophila TaxID=911321 RepID=UPI0037442045
MQSINEKLYYGPLTFESSVSDLGFQVPGAMLRCLVRGDPPATVTAAAVVVVAVATFAALPVLALVEVSAKETQNGMSTEK